ncbi:class I SAM-dependent methyltransferase [Budviciaceae bacterium BWR-B9]|uniref:Class I SAM-dependent methyltransferase n=1 Tax=Limnobaculum allomyrinae TaxID=2791986 RepID=A0ABS1IMH8_9GAMM|nr:MULTISPECIES: class I SAM-dependent methyltransferase [Limnobaculum]MBK5142540.1 class I SAM-dependent methyltransferase [Limnobaculum allomyrinae]MBV7690576.1 class I SAM-dependent methyltransferase [Limnobaculum sp. M2-1]
MNLLDINRRSIPALPWDSGEKIPWNNPEFSQRMLENHLSQQHDWASRRLVVIQRQVEWISQQLPDKQAKILDLGCGPGLYTGMLAKLGYHCVGVDFSPASIAYATEQAKKQQINVEYVLADIRDYQSDQKFDLIMLTFGEFNVFTASDAEQILANATWLLNDHGILVVEVHTYDEVRRQGESLSSWQSHETGLFSTSPHLLLQENYWDEQQATATTRYLIIETQQGNVLEYGSTMQAYTESQYLSMLEHCGLKMTRQLTPEQWPVGETFTDKLIVYVGYK